MNITMVSDWREKVVFSPDGPQPQALIASDRLKSVIVGLQPGQKIPAHPAPTAVYHFLEGSGWMFVDGERLPVQAGSTVVVPAGTPRGVEAETRLSFLGTHAGESQGD